MHHDIPRFRIFPGAVERKSLCNRGFLFVSLTFAVWIATVWYCGFVVGFAFSLWFCVRVIMAFCTALEPSLVLRFSLILLVVSLILICRYIHMHIYFQDWESVRIIESVFLLISAHLTSPKIIIKKKNKLKIYVLFSYYFLLRYYNISGVKVTLCWVHSLNVKLVINRN